MSNRTLGMLMGVVGVLIVAFAVVAVVAFSGGGDDDDDDGNGSPASGDNGDSGDNGGDNGGDDNDGPRVSGICGENRLIVPGLDPISVLDPIQVRDDTTAEYIVEIFGGLVTLDLNLEVVPDIAESWEVLDGGTRYVFTLRDDVVFHNSQRVTAEDFKYSFERAADPDSFSPTVTLYLGEIVGLRDRVNGSADEIEGVRVIDERTLEIEIERPVSYFLDELTYPVAYVVNRQQIEDDPNGWTRRPVGTGPFRLKTFNPGEQIVLIPNERYHLGPPHVDEVVFELAGGSVLTRYENDELHVGAVPVQDLQAVRSGSSDLSPEYFERPEMAIQYIGLNADEAPFDDIKVRQAMAMTLDRDLVNDVRLENAWRVADGILPPEMPGYDEAVAALPYDPEAARALLAESSYAGNLPRIILTYSGSGGSPPDILAIYQQMWEEELGLDVELQAQQTTAFLRDLRTGAFQAFSAGWIADYADPEDFIAKLFATGSDQNEFGYSNDEVDRLVDEAAIELDEERRYELYRQAEEIILNDAAVIPGFWPVEHELVRACVENWPDTPMTIPRYRYIEINTSVE